MTSIAQYISALIMALVLLTSCKTDDPSGPTLQDIAFEKLSGNWSLLNNSGISLDGVDVSLNYPNFSVSFTDGGYTTNNAGELFKSSGTWTWADESAGQINVDDGKEVNIIQLTDMIFQFSFTQPDRGGIQNGLAGNYQITMMK